MGTISSPPWRSRPGRKLVCPECGADFYAPSARGAGVQFARAPAAKCGGTGSVRTVDPHYAGSGRFATIDEGAVAPWNSLMWSLMTDVCREMGVRTDVPFRDLTEREKDIVFHGPAEKKHIFYTREEFQSGGRAGFHLLTTPSIPWKTPFPRSRTKRA